MNSTYLLLTVCRSGGRRKKKEKKNMYPFYYNHGYVKADKKTARLGKEEISFKEEDEGNLTAAFPDWLQSGGKANGKACK